MQNLSVDLPQKTTRSLLSPEELSGILPASPHHLLEVQRARRDVAAILQGQDHRLLVIVGPCSIHDIEAAQEYALLLKKTADQLADDICIIMRTYFEKPRSTIGWKGLISDPYLNGSFDINHGLLLARQLLLTLNQLHLPAGTEFLDPLISHYLSDLITWGAIGARTVESQIHRELASGLAMPIGFKNSTDGNIKVAIDAAHVATLSHHFLSMNKQGISELIETQGNPFSHIILRGSYHSANYAINHIQKAAQLLAEAHLLPHLVVDCSHGNSMKDHARQKMVARDLVAQIRQGSRAISGIMLESHLLAGKQELVRGKELMYGQSVTDGCLGWADTQILLEELALANRVRLRASCLFTP